MRILVSGASGFVGAPLCSYLSEKGHQVFQLVRHKPTSIRQIWWDPEEGKAVQQTFDGFDAVIHLAGEPLSLTRWTQAKKRKILYSRTVSTWFLSHLLSTTPRPPSVFISASASGFYGDRGEELLSENSSCGVGFLPLVCSEWEKGSASLASRGVRTVQTRFGIVLGPHGGILQKMRTPYRFGLGAILGSGMQWVSWISLHDLIHAMEMLLHSSIEGPVNFTSPHPVRQKEFSKVLAHALSRPLFLKIPAPILKLLLGQSAQELLLSSSRVVPQKLIDAGFSFKYPDLLDATKRGYCVV